MHAITPSYYDTTHKAPIKDLAKLNHKTKNIEVLRCDWEIDSHDSDRWNHCTLVAKFKDYDYARQYAELFADLKFIWTGGVLIR